MWEIEVTEEFTSWFLGLTDAQRQAVAAAVDRLEAVGPSLGRPTADRVKGSRHHNMKELRARHGDDHYRVLFAFDPTRTALLLIGGSKTGNWQRWYAEAIPAADDLYDAHLHDLHT